MQERDFNTSIVVDQTPEEVFHAINNVAAWWTGEPGVEGKALKVYDEFSYRFKDIHYSRQRVIELVPSKKIVWLVTESELSFIDQKDEWTGTKIIFDIFEKGKKTEARFTHAGLVQDLECYDDCTNAWSSYVRESLRKFISNTNLALR